MKEVTEPLANGQEVPAYPSNTTARKVLNVREVLDASDGKKLTAGLPRSELAVLMTGQRILEHMYRYCILNNKIYHTRNAVICVVQCTDANNPADPTQS